MPIHEQASGGGGGTGDNVHPMERPKGHLDSSGGGRRWPHCLRDARGPEAEIDDVDRREGNLADRGAGTGGWWTERKREEK